MTLSRSVHGNRSGLPSANRSTVSHLNDSLSHHSHQQAVRSSVSHSGTASYSRHAHRHRESVKIEEIVSEREEVPEITSEHMQDMEEGVSATIYDNASFDARPLGTPRVSVDSKPLEFLPISPMTQASSANCPEHSLRVPNSHTHAETSRATATGRKTSGHRGLDSPLLLRPSQPLPPHSTLRSQTQDVALSQCSIERNSDLPHQHAPNDSADDRVEGASNRGLRRAHRRAASRDLSSLYACSNASESTEAVVDLPVNRFPDTLHIRVRLMTADSVSGHPVHPEGFSSGDDYARVCEYLPIILNMAHIFLFRSC